MLRQLIIATVLVLGCAVPNSTAALMGSTDALTGPSKGPSLTQQRAPLRIIYCEPMAIVIWHGEPKQGLFCVAEPPVQVFPSDPRLD